MKASCHTALINRGSVSPAHGQLDNWGCPLQLLLWKFRAHSDEADLQHSKNTIKQKGKKCSLWLPSAQNYNLKHQFLTTHSLRLCFPKGIFPVAGTVCAWQHLQLLLRAPTCKCTSVVALTRAIFHSVCFYWLTATLQQSAEGRHAYNTEYPVIQNIPII